MVRLSLDWLTRAPSYYDSHKYAILFHEFDAFVFYVNGLVWLIERSLSILQSVMPLLAGGITAVLYIFDLLVVVLSYRCSWLEK